MPVSKNAFKRYSLLDNAIRRKKYPTLENLLDLLEDEGYPVSVSTVEKDLETLRSKFSMPIVYDRLEKGYYYTDKNAYFDIPITNNDVETIWLALDKLSLFRHTEAFSNVRDSLERIMMRLEIDLNKRDKFTEKIIFYEPLPAFAGSEWLSVLYDAICECHSVSFTFNAYANVTIHLIEPYILKEYSDRWYVIGRENNVPVVFGLDRISELDVKKELFVRDKNFYDDMRSNIEHSIGMFNFEKRNHPVQIGYDITLADEIKAKKFHDSQHTSSEDSEEIVISMNVKMDEELLKKAVLPYGYKAKIYGPGFAVSMVKRTLMKALDNYKKD
jgi:predicted DNA-binding transcriptional regulator YafY